MNLNKKIKKRKIIILFNCLRPNRAWKNKAFKIEIKAVTKLFNSLKI